MHKKHIDWKRVGWTVGIPAIIWFSTHGTYLLGKYGHDILGIAQPEYSRYWIIFWINGLVEILVYITIPVAIIITIIWTVINAKYLANDIKNFFIKLFRFYYHNGEDRK
jgi:hypothetical protein